FDLRRDLAGHLPDLAVLHTEIEQLPSFHDASLSRDRPALSAALIELAAEELGDDADALHRRRAARDRPAVRVTVQAFQTVLLGVAVATVDLHGQVGDSLGHL